MNRRQKLTVKLGKRNAEACYQSCTRSGSAFAFYGCGTFYITAFSLLFMLCNEVFIKAFPERNRINVLGAAYAITKEVLVYTNTSYISANCLVSFLKQVKERYNDKPISIVLDNERYQHCFLVKTFAKSLGIHLFLPPYSPNLDIIERVLQVRGCCCVALLYSR